MMACKICATCRFYRPYGDGTGYCSMKDKRVKHESTCADYEED